MTQLESGENGFLAIYLNDHLAGAMLGVELARRARSSNRGVEGIGEELAKVCTEIEADREALELVMKRLGIARNRVKPAGAWVAEKLGRLKLNGRVCSYSPLSRLVELELLYLGITGKMQMWKTLERTFHGEKLGEELSLEQLAEAAACQRSRIEVLHRRAAESAFPSEAASMGSRLS